MMQGMAILESVNAENIGVAYSQNGGLFCSSSYRSSPLLLVVIDYTSIPIDEVYFHTIYRVDGLRPLLNRIFQHWKSLSLHCCDTHPSGIFGGPF